ncbi:3-oxoacyl-[acyl-carrier protein] reductase [Haladaptatus litoreus]|uniref:3-oxoacyl-[acyl-carrier protein] reductase n=1 Tax=Haladaptatus litoreus TaxID=553468 RepID=A0A1N7CL17_9EURY|nr:SDR family oxidoreductase [Haladaptatus litoreus]SIR64338.1 3-oxoacyl-[acyl-carrier protein] reductase [Haladaptatus litoreus]
MDYELDGNVALVTASSSGLGKASAKALAAEGANVVINGRNEERLAEAEDDVRAVAEGGVLAVQGDLTNYDDIEHLVERTVSEFGGIDHLVTNAGGPPSGPFMELDDEDWYGAFDLLVMSVVRLVREAAPHLRENGGGTIVTITSRSVKEAIPSLVLSNAVRMSVIGLEKTLSKELAPEIRSNAVLPAPHETARQQELIQAAVDRGEYDSYEEGLDAKGNINPLGRIGNPMELGDAVAFLSSEQSSFINGVAIPIDGGQGASNL